jgi:hypothetical protein
MHSAALLAIANISDTAYDKSYINSNKKKHKYKCSIWNKSMGYTYDFNISGSSELNTKGKATVFGVDTSPFLLGSGVSFVSSVFVGCSRENLCYTSACSNSDGFISGLKFSWHNKSYGNLNLLCSYGVIKTGNQDCFIRSHMFSGGIRYTNTLPLKGGFAIGPLIQLDYTQIGSEDTKMKYVSINHQNFHNFKTAAGLNLQFVNGDFRASVGTKFNKKFGEDIAGICRDKDASSPKKIASSCLEINTKINWTIKKKTSVGLTLGKFCCGRSGYSANLTLSVAL